MDIVDYVRLHVNVEIGDYLYYVLVDHINFAIERYKNNEYVPMKLSRDIRYNYAKEYEAGKWAWKFINRKMNLRLPKDEATIIAMHIVESEQSTQKSQREISIDELIDEVMKIYRHASSIESCKKHLKDDILPILEDIVIKIGDKKKNPPPVTEILYTILAIGPSDDFIYQIATAKWMGTVCSTTNSHPIAEIIKRANPDTMKEFWDHCKEKDNANWKEIMGLVGYK